MKTRILRVCILILSLTLIGLAGVLATDQAPQQSATQEPPQQATQEPTQDATQDATQEAPPVLSAYQALMQGLTKHQQTIDLSAYALSSDQCQELWNQVLSQEPTLFFVDQSQYQTNTEGETVTDLSPSYTLDTDLTRIALEILETNTKTFLSKIPKGLSRAETLLFIHDKMVLDYAYDNSQSNANAFYLFQRKTGTDRAYAAAFLHLCQQLNIPCAIVSSQDMEHVWNRVEINGKWYHVDVTADDPANDRMGRVQHRFFLLSDAALRAEGHHGFSGGLCSDQSYDNGFWQQCTTAPVYQNGTWYYVNKQDFGLYKISFDKLQPKLLTSINAKWTKAEGVSWEFCFSGLAIYQDKLFYNTNRSLMEFNLTSQTASVVKRLELSEGKSIFALWPSSDGKNLNYAVGSDPNATADTQYSMKLSEAAAVYTIVFEANGSIFRTYTLRHGDTVSAPAGIPTAEENYLFSGWNGYQEGMKATTNLRFVATFRPVSSAVNPLPSGSQPATTVPYTSQPAISGPQASFPILPSVPATTIPEPVAPPPSWTGVMQSNAVQSTKTPGYVDDRPTVSHRLPQATQQDLEDSDTAGVTQSAAPGQPVLMTEDENPAVPWIVAIGAAALVLGAMILWEKWLRPKRLAAKRMAEEQETEDE